MSNHKNYNKMYDSARQQDAPEETAEVAVDVDSATEVEQSVVETEPEAVTGVVVNCAKLNVREQMSTNSKVLCVLPASTEVVVFMDEEYDDWYYVCTEDQTLGYCMKKYISINS